VLGAVTCGLSGRVQGVWSQSGPKRVQLYQLGRNGTDPSAATHDRAEPVNAPARRGTIVLDPVGGELIVGEYVYV